jgi:NADPH:quinone reductase-like Zn-dependent oxidoreductase
MQKVVIRRPGGFDRLELVQAPDPVPGPGEVLIDSAAIGVNFADCVVRMGLYSSAKEFVGWPITPGFEVSGTVRAVGPGVTRFAPGERVVGLMRFGAYASAVTVPENQVFAVPDGLSLEEAGALPVASLTAWYALCELVKLRPGMNVLVHSAAGGVGSALVQIAKIHDCRVLGVVGSAHKVELARSLGADVVVDKSHQDLWAEARKFAPGGFDVVLDANGVETLRKSYCALAPAGRLVVYGFHTMLSRGSGRRNWLKLAWTLLRTPRFDPLDMTDRNRAVLAFNLSYLFTRTDELPAILEQLLGWVKSGQLRVPRVQAYPLERVAEAQSALQSGTTTGKLVLVPSRG